MKNSTLSKDYADFLKQIKNRVIASRYQAVRSVNKELISLYHYIGMEIQKRYTMSSWGAKIIVQLSKDLKALFPEIKGFSETNLKYMKLFAESFSKDEISQQAADQLPWFHIVTILVGVKEKQNRSFYIQKASEYGWSRNILSIKIEQKLHENIGKATTNFNEKLPAPQSDLAQQTLKNPYLFDFLSLGDEAHEREIEKTLVLHMERFLLELGEGFAFLGRQYHLQIEDKDFYIDLLFYHIKLRCYVVVELKAGQFKPEYAGKINFYLSAVDDLLRQPGDNPSIGLILCRSKGGVLAEYALRGMQKPIGLAEYCLTKTLPDSFKTILPTVEELEEEFEVQFYDSKDK